ncbi:BZ3500_MvSof-1268-A1-R1_Chr12-2g03853 [Microbotryum saponariae]|uniref:BZ3500_MvSof-1268-A1-R1_Chr12-2g03853 protein n=1 Tax=Microbotryum saponariae TaxID=289078 RepID=A0A2X0MJF7_9BASI|nr:BZ3500_MvSof-1268-A1-R1_Chr12-2g03853 [Microbotryum saponariae]
MDILGLEEDGWSPQSPTPSPVSAPRTTTARQEPPTASERDETRRPSTIMTCTLLPMTTPAERSSSVAPSDLGEREERSVRLGQEDYWARIEELARMTALADQLELQQPVQVSPPSCMARASIDPGALTGGSAWRQTPRPAMTPNGQAETSTLHPSAHSTPSARPPASNRIGVASPRRRIATPPVQFPSIGSAFQQNSPLPSPTREFYRPSPPPSPSPGPGPRLGSPNSVPSSLHSSQISVESRTLSQILASPSGTHQSQVVIPSSSPSPSARSEDRHSPCARSNSAHAVRPSRSPTPNRPRPHLAALSPSATSSSPSSSAPDSPAKLRPPEPEPAGRALRQRTLAQLNPYSIEQARYTRTLLKNGWQGAVVAGVRKGDEMTKEEMMRKKEELRKKGKDDLGGWLEFEEGEMVRRGQDGSRRMDTEQTSGSEDGEALLEREARRRKRMQREVARAMGPRGVGILESSVPLRRTNDGNDHRGNPVERANQDQAHPTAKRIPGKLSKGMNQSRIRKNEGEEHTPDESSEQDDTNSSASSSAPVVGESSKKRKRALPSKSLHARSKRSALDKSALDSRILEVEMSASSDSSDQEEDSDEEDEDQSMDSASSSSPRRPPLVSPKDKTKLQGKRKKALGMMMPAVFMKKAQKDLVAMEREKREGLTSGSDFGSGDDERLSSSDHAPAKGVARIRRVPELDLAGPLRLKGDAFTDESDEDEDMMGRGSEEEAEEDAVESWLHAFAPRRRVNNDEDIVDRFLKRAKKNTVGTKRKNTKAGNPTGSKTNEKSKTHRRPPLHDKGNRPSHDQTGLTANKANTRPSDQHSRSNRSSSRPRPMRKAVSLDTGDAIFTYARQASLHLVLDEEPGQSDIEQISPRLAPRNMGGVPAVVTRDAPRPPSMTATKTTTTTAPSRAPADENEHWATFGKFSHDFEIELLPVGLQLDGSSFVRRGHLESLLRRHTPDESAHNTRLTLGELALDGAMTPEAVEAMLPQFCDSVFEVICQGDEAEMMTCSGALHLLGRVISSGNVIPTSLSASISSQLNRLEERLDSVSDVAKDVKAFSGRRLVLLWYGFDLAIRLAQPAELVHSLASKLIDRLVHRGVESTMKGLKCASSSPETALNDISLHVWLGLVSVAVQDFDGMTWRQADLWMITLERIAAQLSPRAQKGPIAGEIMSYTTMMLCAISQFSYLGISTSTPRLSAHWGVVMRALQPINVVALARPDRALSNTAIARRDRYIWTLFARCLVFVDRWNWKIDQRSDVLPKLYDILNARCLADLSIETHGDFAIFLQHPDQFNSTKALVLDPKDDTAFSIMLKLITNASQAAVASGEFRQLTRLFSRLTPMTSQAWTRASPELLRSHSTLVNHYSLLITFARLIAAARPASNLALQYLDQARRLIDLAQVDEEARRINVRAVLYFMLAFQAHNLDLASASMWFGSITTQLKKEYIDIEKQRRIDNRGLGRKAGNLPRPTGNDPLWHRAVLLTMILRSIQLVLRSTVKDENAFPELCLLEPAWTSSLLESPLALDPMIGLEIVRTVACFLDLRAKAKPRINATAPLAATGADAGISQDEFGMFDEMDFEDPALNAMLGVESTTAPEGGDDRDLFKRKDAGFAQMIKSELSPAFFRLVSNIFGSTEWRGPTVGDRVAYAQQVVETWIRCVAVMVQHNLVDWSGYLRYGDQSWKRVIDPIGRRTIGLLLAILILRHEPDAYSLFQDDILEIWFQTIVAYSLSSEHILTSRLLNAEPVSPLFEDCRFELDEHTIDERRLDILRIDRGMLTGVFTSAARHLVASNANPLLFAGSKSSLNRAMILNLLRAMLASMKDHLAVGSLFSFPLRSACVPDHYSPISQAITNERSRDSYATFVRNVLDALRGCGAPDVNEQSLVDWRVLEKSVAGVSA